MSIFNSTSKYETVKLHVEDELLLCCARTDVNPEIKDKILSLIQNDIDWDYLLKLASRHRLMPLLYYNLNSICPEMVPEAVLGELKDYFNANVRKNLMMTGELIKVLNLLESEGITVIPYKGPVLASMAYGNIGLRQFNDLDLFIEKSNVIKAKNLLISEGYRSVLNLDHISEFHYLKTQREYLFLSTNRNLIEIHWNFQGPILSLPKGFKPFYNDLKLVNITNSKVLSFNNEDLILILALHSAKHDWGDLSLLSDIYNFISNHDHIKWDEIINNSSFLDIKPILFITLALCNELFDLDIPQEVLIQIKDNNSLLKISKLIKKNLFYENSLNLTEKLYLQMNIRENKFNSIKDCVNGIIVPSFKEFEDLKLPNYLFHLYYIYRPFNLLKSYKLL